MLRDISFETIGCVWKMLRTGGRGLKNLRKFVCIGCTHMVTKLKKGKKKEKKMGASWSSML